MRICKNPACGDEFDPVETSGEFCSWDCSDDYWDELDRQEFEQIVNDSGTGSPVF